MLYASFFVADIGQRWPPLIMARAKPRAAVASYRRYPLRALPLLVVPVCVRRFYRYYRSGRPALPNQLYRRTALYCCLVLSPTFSFLVRSFVYVHSYLFTYVHSVSGYRKTDPGACFFVFFFHVRCYPTETCVHCLFPGHVMRLGYSAHCHYWLFPSLPSDFTGTVAKNRH